MFGYAKREEVNRVRRNLSKDQKDLAETVIALRKRLDQQELLINELVGNNVIDKKHDLLADRILHLERDLKCIKKAIGSGSDFALLTKGRGKDEQTYEKRQGRKRLFS